MVAENENHLSANKHSLISATGNVFPTMLEENENRWENDFIFIHAADPQLGAIHSKRNNGDNSNWCEEIILLRETIQRVNQLSPKPKFFIVCGDLVNSYPGEDYQKEQIEHFKSTFSELNSDIPLICVCGNHDVGEIPTNQTLFDYRKNFGDDYYTFWKSGVLFIVLNSSLIRNHSVPEEECNNHLQWLDEQLKVAKSGKCVHAVVVQHIPMFVQTPDEDDHEDNIAKDIRLELLKKFRESGIRTVLCGHTHYNLEAYDEKIELVGTSSTGYQYGDDLPGVRIVKVTKNTIEHKYYELDSMFPMNIDLSLPLP